MSLPADEGNSASHPVQLRRELGLLDAVGIGFGAIVGAGIFVVTGVAAGVAGPALIAGLAIAGCAAACNALSSAQLAAAYPVSGGTYEYGYRVLHPWAGFAAGWMFLVSKTSAAGAVGIGLGAYLEALFPRLDAGIASVAAILAFTSLNYFGIRASSRANLAIVAISLGSLLAFVLVGAAAIRPANLRPFAPAGFAAMLEAAALLFFAFTGYARIATLGEEVRRPETTIPRAILVTITGAAILYLAVAVVAVGAVGAPAMAESAAPLHTAAAALDVPGITLVISIGGVAAMMGVILSQLLGLSRMAFAMARRRDLPAFLAAVHPTRGVPGRSVLAVGVVAAIVAGAGTLRAVASAAAFAILLYYGIANLAALRMPAEKKLFPDAVPLAGLTACAVLALSLPGGVILVGLGLLMIGFAVRAIIHRIA